MPIQCKRLTGKRKEYNYGIDLLRLIAMFMIVILHVLGKGGVLNNVSGGVEL
jgi:peptidoglycan/LPS O-acetylase OafA/YrhL